MAVKTKFYNLDTDGTLSSNSDLYVASEKAIKTYVDGKIPTVDQTYDSTSSNPQSGKAVASAISGLQAADTAVTHTKNTAAGSTTTPVYIASDGTATAISYTIETSVPSGAVFTDTKNTAGGDDTSSKIFLVGMTAQTTSNGNARTYTQDTAFVDANGRLNSAAPASAANDTTVATTKWVKDQGYSATKATIRTWS